MTRSEKIAYCVNHNIFYKEIEGSLNTFPATAEDIDAEMTDSELDEVISKHSKAESLGSN